MKNFGKTTDIRDIITVGYEADNAVLYSTSQSLTNDQKIQARANIGAGTSNFDGNYDSLDNKPTIPTKTSQLENNSNFATTSQVEAKYTKPKGGIPKTDLATAVQNSLTAADNAVKYTSQSLTDAQKKQARTNIGAGTSNFSGSYKDLADKPPIPPEVSIVQSTGESTSSVMSQKATTNAVNGRLSKTDNTNIEVLGTKKSTTTLGGNQLYAPNGIIFGGTAAAAGLVTSGICGVSTPSDGGACSKENLYINYDGNNDFNAGRQVVLNAGTVGNHLGSNMYQYTAPRGEIVKNWVEAKGYATSVKVNGNTIASSGGVVDIGTVLTDASKFATAAQGTKADNAMPKKGGTFTGEVTFGSTENFQGYYIKRMIGSLGPGTAYNNLDSSYKDGTWHRMWRLRFPSGSSFWGKIKVTLYGGYSSFNASGVMSKSITCNFNTSNIYNNVGCYDGLGVNVEQDFRISEAIWNATVSAWEVLIWQKNLNGNNSPAIMLECWTRNDTNYINAFNGITAQPVELTQSTSYSAQKASPTGGTKTVEWATLPVYENPLGEEIATMSDLPNSVKSVIDYNNTNNRIKIGYSGDGLSGDSIKYIAGYTTGDSESAARIKDINKDALKSWLGYATVATSGSYNDLVDKPTIPNTAKHSSTQLATNTDLNTLNSSADIGWYHVGGGNSCAHKPTGVDAFGLEVGRSAGGWFYQVLTSSNAATSSGRCFMRTYSGTAWGGWTKVAITSEIPAVNDGTLTIQKNGTNVQTFTANQSSSVTANITVPTKVSELENDSGFITSAPANYTNSSRTPSQCTANGFYYVISSTNSLTDADGNPFLQYHASNNDFRILATAWDDSWVQQIATDFRSTHIYYRIRNSGTWEAWTEIAKISDIPDISGKLDKTKYEVNKTIDFGSSGVLYVGKFKVYDTNVTCEVTSTTNVTYSGKLVIATQNYVISEAKVYGDATNTVAPNFYIKPSTTSDPYIEVYFKPSSWSKNVVHIYGSNIQAAPTDVCTNVPSVPSAATLKPKNALTFELSGTTLTITL